MHPRTLNKRGGIMGDTIHLAQYFKMKTADKPGQAARVLDSLRDAGVNLLAF